MSDDVKQFRPNKVTLFTILLASMMILMGAAAVAPALEPISKAFPDASKVMVSLVVTLPALGVSITGFAMGYLADRFGKARIFVVSLGIFTVAGVFGFFLDSLGSILVVRFILGIGIAGISLGTTALISEYYEGANRVKVIAMQSAAMGAGVLVLESLGGALADIGWQEPFLVYLIGVPILLLALISVREPVSVGYHENILPGAVIPNKARKAVVSYLMIFLAMFMMFIIPTNLPYHAAEIGSNMFVCGLLLGVLGVSQAVFSLLYSRSFRKLSDLSAFAVAFALVAIGFCLMYSTEMALIVLAMIFIGMGMGLITLTVVGTLSHISQAGESGKIMGGYSVAFNLGIFTSSLVMSPIVVALNSYTVTFAYVGVFAFIVCAACTVASIFRSRSVAPVKSVAKAPQQDVQVKSDIVPEFERILLATDGSSNSRVAVRTALKIAKNSGSKVTALYVFDSESYATNVTMPSATDIRNLGDAVSKDALHYACEEADRMGVKVSTMILYGHPAETIVEESPKYSLIVCGSLGRTNFSRALMGSVAEKIVRLSKCPVLVCREPDEN